MNRNDSDSSLPTAARNRERTLFIDIVCVSVAGHEHVPSWVWVAAGLFNFLAYTLGESGPLQVQSVVFWDIFLHWNVFCTVTQRPWLCFILKES